MLSPGLSAAGVTDNSTGVTDNSTGVPTTDPVGDEHSVRAVHLDLGHGMWSWQQSGAPVVAHYYLW